MESTKMLMAIEELRAHFGKPQSHMDIVRHSVLSELARINKVEMPPILEEKHRRVFMANIERLAGFLSSHDGADAVELLVNAFENYCVKMAEKEAEKADPEEDCDDPEETEETEDDDD